MSHLQHEVDPLQPLLAKLFDGRLTAIEQEQLEALLASDADRQREYADYVHAHALLLFWSAAHASTTTDKHSRSGITEATGADSAYHAASKGRLLVSKSMRFASNFQLAAAALVILAAMASAVYWARHHLPVTDLNIDNPGLAQSQTPGGASFESPRGGPMSVALVTQQWHPVWNSTQTALQNWSRIEVGHELRLESGRVACMFDVGAEVIMHGPAKLRVLGANLIQLDYGDLGVRVSESGRGFTVVSANGKVVDLGTEFGIRVQSGGAMDVAVFEGEVELERRSSSRSLAQGKVARGAPLRIAMGQAISVSPDGASSRISQVNYDQFPRSSDFFTRRKATDPVIESISDNLRAEEFGPFYQICSGGLVEDARAYVDRVYEWNGVDKGGIPEPLIGADYVLMFNDDKRHPDYEITIQLAQSAFLYVFWDQRYAPPEWLESRFARTDYRIAMDTNLSELMLGVGPGVHVDDVFSIWRLRVDDPSEPVKLGALWTDIDASPPTKMGVSMYGIAAVALHE